jgi:hypothetical protein
MHTLDKSRVHEQNEMPFPRTDARLKRLSYLQGIAGPDDGPMYFVVLKAILHPFFA